MSMWMGMGMGWKSTRRMMRSSYLKRFETLGCRCWFRQTVPGVPTCCKARTGLARQISERALGV